MGVDTWDFTPGATEGGGWKPDDAGVAVGGWEPDTTGGDDTFTGEFSPENISKHANGNFGGASDRGCRICGEESHFARDCPQKVDRPSGCFNCGSEEHMKADCPNPRVEREFTGECRNCGETGHRAADCPSKAPEVCKLCNQEGHKKGECTVNRIITNFLNLGIPEMEVEDAWREIGNADEAKDMSAMKTAILTYAKAYPEVTFPEFESAFRDAGMNTYLIAKKQNDSDVHTIVNLQGKGEQTYAISFQLSPKPRRAKFAEGWPESAEENMTRLAEAGFVMDGLVEKCSNCNQLGHSARKCSEPKVEPTKTVPKCYVCNEDGHYARDCTEARKVPGEKKACRHCQSVDHLAKECPDKPMLCRNCDEEGHISKECPHPKDWSRVKCSNCQEHGHGAKRCPNPPKDDDDAGADGGDGGYGNGGGDDWGTPANNDSAGGW